LERRTLNLALYIVSLVGYTYRVYIIHQTHEFSDWLHSLKDKRARTIIGARIDRFARGNPGDAKSVGGRVSEMRIPYGPGYRVYYTKQSNVIIMILCGGTKKRQTKDIERAKMLAKEFR